MISSLIKDMAKSVVEANSRIMHIDSGPIETPLDASQVFSTRTGAEFLLKGEHLQRTGSFKIRGAMNRILNITREDREKGVIAASSGNHGVATALAAHVAGLQATIYLPEVVSEAKHKKIRKLGAKTVLVAGNTVEGEIAGRAAADRNGVPFVSPYADWDVIAGQGTIGMELQRQCPQLAAVYLALGGGGLVGGIGSYLKACMPETDVIACSPQNAPAMYLCLKNGAIYDTPETDTLSDGTAGAIEEGAISFDVCKQVIDRHILVSEAEIALAIKDMAADESFMIEGAAGVALAAALKDAKRYEGRKVAVVVCGRNITLEKFCMILDRCE